MKCLAVPEREIRPVVEVAHEFVGRGRVVMDCHVPGRDPIGSTRRPHEIHCGESNGAARARGVILDVTAACRITGAGDLRQVGQLVIRGDNRGIRMDRRLERVGEPKGVDLRVDQEFYEGFVLCVSCRESLLFD